ncbi:MAG TPA: hypothetical protein VJR92_12740 [Gemmatimonadaceae bacterium]|nr:hypothetical protein [Gemmatimonadaceae bacterium]
MNNGVFGEAAIVQPGRYPAAELVATAWNGKKPNADSPTVTAIVASENSQRMLMQLGAFTIHGVRTPLDDYPNAERFLRCYDVPAAAKKPLAAQLARAGIRRSSLFPDLDNLSAEIAATHVDGWPVGAPPAIETLAEPIGGSVVVGDV